MIKLLVLAAEVPEVGRRTEWLPCRTLDQLRRRVLAAMLVHVFFKPSVERMKLPTGDLVDDLGLLLERAIVELRTQDVAQRIALKGPADQSGEPMHVLEDAITIVARGDA